MTTETMHTEMLLSLDPIDALAEPDEPGFLVTGKCEAPFTCKYCGLPSWLDPVDQSPPPDYCHEMDHGSEAAGVTACTNAN